MDRPGGSSMRAGSSGSWSSGTLRASSRIARISWLRLRSAGRLKSRSASRSRRSVGRRRGDGHQQVVAEHLAQRTVLPPRFVLAPFGEPPGHLQAAAARAGAVREAAATALRRPAARSIARNSANSASAQVVRPSSTSRSVKMIGQVEQMTNVVEGILKLGRRLSGRCRQSVRVSLPARLMPSTCPTRLTERERITETHQSRGDLDVEDALGQLTGPQQADPQVLARRVHHDLEPAGSCTTPRTDVRSRTASGSITASRSRVATWIRQSTGSNVSSRDKLGVEGESADGPRCSTSSSSWAGVVMNRFGSRLRHQCRSSRLFKNSEDGGVGRRRVFVGSHVAGLRDHLEPARLGIASAMAWASAGGVITSSSPTRTSVGTEILGSSPRRSGRIGHAPQCAGDPLRASFAP